YRLTNQLKLENASLQKIISIKNLIQQSSKLKQAEALQFAFIFEKKEKEIEDARIQEQELQSQLNLNSRRIMSLIGIVGFLLISLIFFFVQMKRNTKTRKQLEKLNSIISQKNTAIESSLKQKEVLLKEIHHRVKNNLQMISSLLNLQISKVDNDFAKNALIDGQSRVQAIALVHQNLYLSNDISQISFHEYAKNLIENILRAQNRDNITYQISSKLTLEIDTSVTLGLIITEIITNSIKHSNSEKPLHVEILLRKNEISRNILIIRDNGSGFDMDQLDVNKTLGIKLIQLLSKNIKGDLKLQSSDSGTSYEITLPA
ncbi:MAG: sensor histidine kinase, partial [Bacteroidota bacterium]